MSRLFGVRDLRPTLYLPSVTRLTTRYLRDHGVRGLILDLDNTLVPYAEDTPSRAVIRWLAELEHAGIKACILSNVPRIGPKLAQHPLYVILVPLEVQGFILRRQLRVRSVADGFGLPWLVGHKPDPGCFRAAMHEMGLTGNETMVVGDQIYRDILGGNRAGCRTVLVDPLSNQEFIGTRLARVREQLTKSLLLDLQRIDLLDQLE